MSKPRRMRRAITIIEVVISMLVVSTMLTAALYAVGASRLTLTRARNQVLAAQLADDLLGFIYKLPYQSPSGSLLGIELGNLLGDKTTYDDVDDFDGYSESPPTYANGQAMAGMSGWARVVKVDWVSYADPSTAVGAETGIKRIIVIVTRNGAEIARRTALRTNLSAASE